MRTVWTIAGFDPSSGAGVTADLMVFAAHGLFGCSCITALTVQSTVGVKAVQPVAASLVKGTLAHLGEDLPPAGIKIGMLGSAENVLTVAEFLSNHRDVPVVLDPVMRSSSGRALLSREGVEALRERLLPLATWLTPNFEELATLTGFEATPETLPAAANALTGEFPGLNILVTGGDREKPDDWLFTPDRASHCLPGEHVATRSTHGTGCALSSALLSRLVLGDDPLTAALAAKHYVAEALRTAIPKGRGRGPVNHLWPIRSNEERG